MHDNLAALELSGIDQWFGAVLVRVHRTIEESENVRPLPIGYVFVRERKYGEHAFWKLPGGHRKNSESPLETAVRELLGETNLTVAPAQLYFRGQWLGRRRDHWKIIFTTSIEERELGWMNDQHPENEGEEPKFFRTDEFYELVRAGKFMPEHYDKLVEFGAILPPPGMPGSAR